MLVIVAIHRYLLTSSETHSAQGWGPYGTFLPGRKLQVCWETWLFKSYIMLRNTDQQGRLWQSREVPYE